MSINSDFEKWASTKDFYDTKCVYPYDSYIRQEMQVAWIAWKASYVKYKEAEPVVLQHGIRC